MPAKPHKIRIFQGFNDEVQCICHPNLKKNIKTGLTTEQNGTVLLYCAWAGCCGG